MMDLEKLRIEIDEIDRQIVKLFESRMEIVSKVSEYKLENNLPVLNSEREKEVVDKNTRYLKNKELSPYLKDFYKNLMDISKDYQNTKMINYEGIKEKRLNS